MADKHAVPLAEEEKTHGDAIPPAENGGHSRSVAAHLQDHTNIHDNKNAVQHHVPSNKLNETPEEVSLKGKDNRRQ